MNFDSYYVMYFAFVISPLKLLFSGMIVPGGFGERGIEGKIAAAGWARRSGRPFLGVCLGMQCAVIEFARSELGWTKANSTEFDPNTAHPVVVDMPEHNPGQMGGTMRLGLRKTQFTSMASKLSKFFYLSQIFLKVCNGFTPFLLKTVVSLCVLFLGRRKSFKYEQKVVRDCGPVALCPLFRDRCSYL